MRGMRAVTAVAAAAVALALSTSAFAYGSISQVAGGRPSATQTGGVVPAGTGTMAVCPHAAAGQARCLAEGVTVAPGSHTLLQTKVFVNGLTPANIVSAYNLPATGGAGNTVAVVEAGSYPHLESDLATYRSNFGLPACTTKNGCLQIVNQTGGPDLPPVRNGWSIETALDVDAVSASCPTCNILVVEANDSHMRHLGIGNATAAKMGALAVSNSWKFPEFEGMNEAPWSNYFQASGVAFMASSGDGGHTAQVTIGYPAGLPSVLAIGGTALRASSDARGWTETAWSGAGSGCGQFVPKPSWQKDEGCTMRSTSDVSAVADPATGLAVYHTLRSGAGGWAVYGGTSLSSPLIAGMYGLAGNTGALGDQIAQHLYANAKHLNDVTEGSNGTCPPEYPYICQAGKGYDGPTGLGTPNGLKAL